MLKKSIRRICILSLLFMLIFNACSVIKRFQPTPTPTLFPTPIPTATPQVNRVVLIAPPNADTNLVAEAQKTLTDLAASSELVFETRQQISSKEITADIKIIVFLNHPDNLGALSNAASKTQFAVISDLNWNPTSNVTIIRRQPEYIYFIAGLITVILDNNFRGGALIPSEDTSSQQAFTNGGHYYCGICMSTIQPFAKYPLIAAQPGGSPSANWQTAFDQMNINMIKVLYITPEAYSTELFTYLVSKNIILLGTQTPPEAAKSRWAATLQMDGISPLREIWPDLIAGKGGKVVYGGVRFIDIQPALLPQGKLDFVQRIVAKLRSRMINPQSIPLE